MALTPFRRATRLSPQLDPKHCDRLGGRSDILLDGSQPNLAAPNSAGPKIAA